MQGAKAASLIQRKIGTERINKIIWYSFPFQPNDLSLKLNIGTSITSTSAENIAIAAIIQAVGMGKIPEWKPTNSPSQNKALAGVGIPINEEVCRVS